MAEDWLADHGGAVRLGVFLALLAALALLELAIPRHRRPAGRARRWPLNMGFSILNTLVVRLVAPAGAAAGAVWATAQGVGLFNMVAWPPWLEVALAVLLLDLAIYWQHRAMHAAPALWRLHLMHHTEPHLDVTTAVRFHPLEILVSMGIKIAVVAALGAPLLAVFIFEVLLNATAMFNHANISLGRLDRWLRLVVVTPGMHVVHHSIRREEQDSNFGFNLPWWDHLFASYRAAPRDGVADMAMGHEAYPPRRAANPLALAASPFAREAGR